MTPPTPTAAQMETARVTVYECTHETECRLVCLACIAGALADAWAAGYAAGQSTTARRPIESVEPSEWVNGESP